MTILYGIAIAVLTAYGVNLLWLSSRYALTDRLIEGPVPEPGVLPDAPTAWPTVTIQLPLYNEPRVADRLIDACAQIDYPAGRVEIQVLDDSTDETPAIVAARTAHWQRKGVNIVHIRRLQRDGYKAGALQNGLRIAEGQLIAIFDADFVPRPDFLRRLVPEFSDENIGVVQARWGHMNADASLLTRIQAVGLDTHFAVEQRTRNLSNCFINFNGTAGIWRRACIEDAGGWQADTIAEDLDLSYRAQLAGWSFKFLDDVDVPAELPSTMRGLRTQQFRWAKGSVETASKLLRPLWRSGESLRRKVEGTLHLTAHLVFPFVLLAALIHAPILAGKHAGAGPGEVYFGWMALGLVGFAGFGVAQLLAQRRLYADWPRRLRTLPAFMAGTIGLSVSNTQAVVEALAGKRTPFIRTPKFGEEASKRTPRPPNTYQDSKPETRAAGTERSVVNPKPRPQAGQPATRNPSRRHGAKRSKPATPASSRLASRLEAGMLIYSIAALGYLLYIGEWAAVPFQLLFAIGFGLVVAADLQDRGTAAA